MTRLWMTCDANWRPPSLGGVGVMVQEDDRPVAAISHVLTPMMDATESELFAIASGLRWLSRQAETWEGADLIVTSDSQPALLMIAGIGDNGHYQAAVNACRLFRAALLTYGMRLRYRWLPREETTEAHDLAALAVEGWRTDWRTNKTCTPAQKQTFFDAMAKVTDQGNWTQFFRSSDEDSLGLRPPPIIGIEEDQYGLNLLDFDKAVQHHLAHRHTRDELKMLGAHMWRWRKVLTGLKIETERHIMKTLQKVSEGKQDNKGMVEGLSQRLARIRDVLEMINDKEEVGA